jgi:hypothetical protein
MGHTVPARQATFSAMTSLSILVRQSEWHILIVPALEQRERHSYNAPNVRS